jgi:hypothetical protein
MQPIFFDYANVHNRQSPTTYKVSNTGLAQYFKRYLLQSAISMFNWKNIPSFWDSEFLLYNLYNIGYLAVVDTPQYGVIPQICSLTGYDVFYRPTTATIANPAFRETLVRTIGKDCEILKLCPDYGGIYDIISYFGDMLAVASESVAVNLINVKTTPIFEASSKSEAETLKKMYDKVASGEPCVVTDGEVTKLSKNGNFNFFVPPTVNMFVSDKLLNAMREIENMFDSYIGIPNANVVKKERLVTDEVNANNVETSCKIDLWLETVSECVARINKMFGLQIEVTKKYGGEKKNESDNDNNQRPDKISPDTMG